ncbi:MAG: CocE/NonD family hydrolase, partial [Terriglobia bacterium]
MKPRISLIAAIIVLVLASIPDWAAPSYKVSLLQNVPVKMRDGVILRADIYRPDAPGKFPVLLERTPYNKANE